MASPYTTIYFSMLREDDEFVDKLRMELVRRHKKPYTKADTIKHLFNLGREVEEGRWLRLDDNIDKFVSQLQELVLVIKGQEVRIKKTKQQVYSMLIELGLQHLNDAPR